jgi:Family of unknown function (DUF5681)
MNTPFFPDAEPHDQAACPPEEAEDAVGHCRPPRRTRFQPGLSGNPRGRPNRAKILGTLIARAFQETVEVPEKDGRTRRMSKLELALTQLVNASASGDLRATQLALSLLPSPQEKAAPRKMRRIGKEDSLVVAEIIRRFSRPPAPAAQAADEATAPPEGETP